MGETGAEGRGTWRGPATTDEGLPVSERAAVVWRRRHVLLRFFVRRCGSWEEAEDLLGELVLVALRHGRPVDPVARLRWLLGRANGLVGQYLFRCQRRKSLAGTVHSLHEWRKQGGGEHSAATLEDALPSAGPPIDELVGTRALWAEVQAALAKLPKHDSRLLLALAEGHSLRRLADKRRTTRHRLTIAATEARARLWALLSPDAAEEVRRLVGEEH